MRPCSLLVPPLCPCPTRPLLCPHPHFAPLLVPPRITRLRHSLQAGIPSPRPIVPFVRRHATPSLEGRSGLSGRGPRRPHTVLPARPSAMLVHLALPPLHFLQARPLVFFPSRQPRPHSLTPTPPSLPIHILRTITPITLHCPHRTQETFPLPPSLPPHPNCVSQCTSTAQEARCFHHQ